MCANWKPVGEAARQVCIVQTPGPTQKYPNVHEGDTHTNIIKAEEAKAERERRRSETKTEEETARANVVIVPEDSAGQERIIAWLKERAYGHRVAHYAGGFYAIRASVPYLVLGVLSEVEGVERVSVGREAELDTGGH